MQRTWKSAVALTFFVGALRIFLVRRASQSVDHISTIFKNKKTTYSKSKLLTRLNHDTVVRAMDSLCEGRLILMNKQYDGSSSQTQGLYQRQLKHKTSKSSDNAAEFTCEEELATLALEEDAKAKQPKLKYLFVQMADKCILDIDNTTGLEHVLIESMNFLNETETFSDRPFQLQYTESTDTWFRNFMQLFNETSGWPNAAITFRNNESEGVVVSVFVEAFIKNTNSSDGHGPTYGYRLKQSEDQVNVQSLKDLMRMGGNHSKSKVEFDHCSIFVDVS